MNLEDIFLPNLVAYCNRNQISIGSDIIKVLKKSAIWIALGILAVIAFIKNDSDTLNLMTATFLICLQLDAIKEEIVDEIKKNN